ncbi:serine hydrolase [Pseudacidovorax intermedius]|uniref:serine hydrolase n=1 Tax=Pseudacidovorax intermedius TaxID=433924 RepID=UPI0026EC21BD|nr:serine hydrolase [Pseudacidovorax intermedius]
MRPSVLHRLCRLMRLPGAPAFLLSLCAAAPAQVQPLAPAPVTVPGTPTHVAPVPSVVPALPPTSSTGADWRARMASAMQQLDGGPQTGIGVYVLDLASGQSFGHRADERWYLASMVKVPVAIAVLQAVERGEITLDTTVTFRAGDRVDGAGATLRQPLGASLSVRWLMGQMIIYSDNTATDMLIDLVGLQAVNGVVQALAPRGIARITPLAEVRRQVYGQLTPAAGHLSGSDLLALHRAGGDAAKRRQLADLLALSPGQLKAGSLDAAYDAYYAEGLNSGRLDAYAQILVALAEGRALGAEATQTLLKLMEDVATGPQRLRAGLPPQARFAHKTGTQRRRICDAGLVRMPGTDARHPVVLVACVRDAPSLTRAEHLLAQTAAALCRSGLLTQGLPDAPTCPAFMPDDRHGAAAAGVAR